jgi:O-antigen/teichoic acid export membrane protein
MTTPARSAARTIARNTLFGILTTLVLKFGTILFNIFIVNHLGEGEIGQYAVVLGWASLFSVLGDMGVQRYLAREIARVPEKKDELFWDSVMLRFFFAILCTGVTVAGAVALTDFTPEMQWGVAIFCLTYFVQVLMSPLHSILAGNERLDLVNLTNVLMNLFYMGLSVLFFLSGGEGFVWLLLAGVINMPLVVLIQYSFIRRLKLQPPRFRINRRLWWGLVRASLPFAAIQLALSLSFRVDTVLLNRFGVADGFIGWYSIAYTQLVLMMLNFAQTFTEAVMPTLSREHAANPEAIKPWYFNASRLIVALALPIAVGGMLMADKIIAFLYEPGIAPAAVALAILVWDIPFVMYHAFCGNVTQSIQQEGHAARIYTLMAIFNVTLNLLLIPRFGIIAAAFVTVLTDAFGALQYYFVLRRALGPGLQFHRFLRIGLSSAVMAGVLLLLRDSLHVLPLIALAGVIYLGIAWLSGVFTPEERERLVGMVARRLRLRTA